MIDDRYAERREHLEAKFVPENRVEDSENSHVSPCGKYRLNISRFSIGPKSWDISQGIVTRMEDQRVIADVKRNIGHFWHAWVQHANGYEYLLCGEDYQGYSVINLTTEKTHVYFPEAGYDGFGFCWTAVYPSPDSLMLAVDGCYWACSYEVVFYDFRDPEHLPLPEIERIDSLDDCEGWRDNETFVLNREIEYRKSDGKPYDTLTDEEQDVLDNDSTLSDYRIEEVKFTRKPLGD